MISKEKIASALNHFSTEIDLEQFIDELILLEKIENGAVATTGVNGFL